MKEKIQVVRGDITVQNVDAIVNAANNSLLGGGGVDGAIHRAAGPDLLEACKKLNGCRTGAARITPGFRLPARWVIHTVGPVWHGGTKGEPELLAGCYRACYELAEDHRLNSVAFPSISTGAYGYPIDAASAIALRETMSWLEKNPGFEKVLFVCFDQANFNRYSQLVG